MTQPDQDKIWLTQEAYDKLQAELENLKGPVRQEIIARISAARDEGDLKENGGYHAAREEQGKLEARIRQLEDMLRRAEVGETPADDGVVEPGMKVTYKFVGDDDDGRRSCSAPARSSDDGTDSTSTRRSPRSARRILGAKVGDTVSYDAPNGKELKVEIVDASPTPADATALDGPSTTVSSNGTDTGSRARGAGREHLRRRAGGRGSPAGAAPRPRRGAGPARCARGRPRARWRRPRRAR